MTGPRRKKINTVYATQKLFELKKESTFINKNHNDTKKTEYADISIYNDLEHHEKNKRIKILPFTCLQIFPLIKTTLKN